MTNDPVNKPKHYSESKIECISAIEALRGRCYEYYLQGNIIKYLWRYRNKNGIEDLKKAQWYLNEMIRIKEEQ